RDQRAPLKECVGEAKGAAATAARPLRIPGVNILTGPPVTVDGRILDTRTQWLLQLLARSGHAPVESMSVAEARAEIDAFMPVLAGGAAPVGEILDPPLDTTAGRRRGPPHPPAGGAARLLPTILSLRGGGWPIGRLEASALPCRFFCARTGCALIAVDYRLAPEHKFPAAIDDAVGAYRWLAAQAVALGSDPARIVL